MAGQPGEPGRYPSSSRARRGGGTSRVPWGRPPCIMQALAALLHSERSSRANGQVRRRDLGRCYLVASSGGVLSGRLKQLSSSSTRWALGRQRPAVRRLAVGLAPQNATPREGRRVWGRRKKTRLELPFLSRRRWGGGTHVTAADSVADLALRGTSQMAPIRADEKCGASEWRPRSRVPRSRQRRGQPPDAVSRRGVVDLGRQGPRGAFRTSATTSDGARDRKRRGEQQEPAASTGEHPATTSTGPPPPPRADPVARCWWSGGARVRCNMHRRGHRSPLGGW